MAIERLTISLAPELRAWINDRIEAGKYASASDYVATLIRDDRRQGNLDQLLTEGLDSGPAIEADKAYWDGKKAALKKRRARG